MIQSVATDECKLLLPNTITFKLPPTLTELRIISRDAPYDLFTFLAPFRSKESESLPIIARLIFLASNPLQGQMKLELLAMLDQTKYHKVVMHFQRPSLQGHTIPDVKKSTKEEDQSPNNVSWSDGIPRRLLRREQQRALQSSKVEASWMFEDLLTRPDDNS